MSPVEALLEALREIAEYDIDWRESPAVNVGRMQSMAEDAMAAYAAATATPVPAPAAVPDVPPLTLSAGDVATMTPDTLMLLAAEWIDDNAAMADGGGSWADLTAALRRAAEATPPAAKQGRLTVADALAWVNARQATDTGTVAADLLDLVNGDPAKQGEPR